jgi:ABC-type branched-subunit amino acid transport system substrate-binding protein
VSGTREALLVGCPLYDDSTFPQLPAERDVEVLARVLGDREIGNFTVATLCNEESNTIRVKIEQFFANRKPDDLLLLYFSCHGIRDPSGQLYFVARDTRKELLSSRGISAKWVKEQMDGSRSQRIVLLLDCCYSGAFTRSLMHRDPSAREIVGQLSGHGRIIITASSKTEFAYESEFTDAVIRGLETGAADLDGDGQVSASELYDYVYDQVLRNAQGQTPTMSMDGMRGRLYLAKNPHKPLPLPSMIEQVWNNPKNTRERLWMVESLHHLLTDDHPGGLKITARRKLEQLHDHDASIWVRKAARNALHNASRHASDTAGRRGRYRRIAKVLVPSVIVPFLVIPPFLPSGEPPPCTPRTIAADGVLSLGTLLPMTGQFVYTGPPLHAGVQLAMKDINDSGAIHGIFMKLDQANQLDEGDPSAGVANQSTDTLLAGGVDVMIGPATSATARNVIDKVTCAGVVMFSPSNTSSLFTMYPDHGLYFRTSPPSKSEGSALGKLAGKSTAVVMSRDDPYGNPLRDETVKSIQKSGGRVLDSFPYDPNVADYGREIKRVKDKNPEVIVLIGFNESARILAGLIKEGLGPRVKQVYGSTATMTTTLAGRVSPRDPSVLTGMQGLLPNVGDEDFVKRLRESNPGLQDLTYAAQAYDAVVITALAAAIAGTDAPAAIAKEINGVTRSGERCTSFKACMTLVRDHKDFAYVGPSGPLEFADPGEPSTATYTVSEIQADGTIRPLREVTS